MASDETTCMISDEGDSSDDDDIDIGVRMAFTPGSENIYTQRLSKRPDVEDSNLTYARLKTEGINNPVSKEPPEGVAEESDVYAGILRSKQLWPVDAAIEQDWSGRGQHAEFDKHERRLINETLYVRTTIGLTKTAKVESVKCRRILLARKTMVCSRQLKKDQAIEEVAHLTRLKHAHILRVIGTYVVEKELSILLYPVADYDLELFLTALRGDDVSNFERANMLDASNKFFGCLSSSLSYIHSMLTKHMDIKPQNILVKRKPNMRRVYRVYIADFGIAHSYQTLEDTVTDGATSFTAKYAAPEVIAQDMRGLPADIFSLGCVFLELHLTLQDATLLTIPYAGLESRPLQWPLLQNLLCKNVEGSTSYQANLETLKGLFDDTTPQIIWNMIDRDPLIRPTAAELSIHFTAHRCCNKGPCVLEATSEDSDADFEDVALEEFPEYTDNRSAAVREKAIEFLVKNYTRDQILKAMLLAR